MQCSELVFSGLVKAAKRVLRFASVPVEFYFGPSYDCACAHAIFISEDRISNCSFEVSLLRGGGRVVSGGGT